MIVYHGIKSEFTSAACTSKFNTIEDIIKRSLGQKKSKLIGSEAYCTGLHYKQVRNHLLTLTDNGEETCRRLKKTEIGNK
jgi:hypothetical protein